MCTQRSHGVKMTSYKRRCDVMTSHRHRYDVILAPLPTGYGWFTTVQVLNIFEEQKLDTFEQELMSYSRLTGFDALLINRMVYYKFRVIL